jgi:hypothetical protein
MTQHAYLLELMLRPMCARARMGCRTVSPQAPKPAHEHPRPLQPASAVSNPADVRRRALGGAKRSMDPQFFRIEEVLFSSDFLTGCYQAVLPRRPSDNSLASGTRLHRSSTRCDTLCESDVAVALCLVCHLGAQGNGVREVITQLQRAERAREI